MAEQNFKVNFIASIGGMARNAKTAKTAVDGLGQSAKKLKTGFAGFYSEMRKNNMMFTNFTKDANRANDGILKLNKSLGGFNQVVGMAKSSLVAFSFANAINGATEMVETTNLFNVAMGENAKESKKFVDAMSEAYGFDPTNIMSAVGTYSLLARSMGMSSDQAKILSENTYKLAVDLSSLTNVPINQVLGDLRSGLVGQSETVYKYGIDITEATLKTEAMAQGIEKSVRNMSQGEKMALRYSAMIRQSALAHGDFARTIETPANQMKIMSELTVTLTRTIGTVFLPMLAKILPYVNAVLMVLIRITKAIATLFGYKAPELIDGLGTNMGGYGEDFEDSMAGSLDKLKKMKQVTMGFDELNVISEQEDASGGAGTGPSIGGIDFDLPGMDNLMETIQNRTKEIADKLEGPLKVVLGLVGLIGAGFLAWRLGSIVSSLAGFVGGMKKLAGWMLIISGGIITIQALADIFETEKPTLEQFGEALLGIAIVAGGVALAFTPVTGAVVLLVGAIGLIGIAVYKYWDEIKAFAKGMWDEFKKLGEQLKEYFAGVGQNMLDAWDVIKDKFKENLDVLVGFFSNAREGIKSIFGSLETWFNDTVLTGFLVVVAIFDAKLNELRGFFESAWNGIKEIWGKVGEWFRLNVANPLEKVSKGIVNFMISCWNIVIYAFETALNFMIGGINKFIMWIDELVEKVNSISEKVGISVNFNMSPISPVSLGRVPQLARGGSLDRGQLFEAGEFGKAEAIGSYQGKTTVMPLENTDFVGAIYNAVRDAMTDTASEGGQVVENVLMLDGEVIYRNQKKVESKRGYDFGLGVFAR